MGKIKRAKHGPEWYLQNDLVAFLEARGWLVERIVGNAFQSGLPDLYCWHPKWGQRWVDVKVEGSYSFTKAQKFKWPEWEKFGLGVWILTGANQEQYDRLMRPPNMRDYWKSSWDERPDIDAMLDELDQTE